MSSALTANQRQIASETLREYLAGPYRAAHPPDLALPTFSVAWKTLKGEHAHTTNQEGRRAAGTHSDPTATEALIDLEGRAIAIPVVEMVSPVAVGMVLHSLPTHLYFAVHRHLVCGHVQELIAHDEHVGRSTISQRITDGLVEVCAVLYGPRWQMSLAVAS